MAIINGNAANNLLLGTGFDDMIDGQAGNDWIFGGAGHDDLYGGLGNDFLFGGAGEDYFIFDGNSGNDIIWDFTQGEDKIEIDPTVLPDIGEIMSNISYGNGFAKIDLGGGNNIHVNGIAPNNPLTEDDFVEFVSVDFEDLPPSNGIPMPDEYLGFNWKLDNGGNPYYYQGMVAGYGVMGTQLIYNAGGQTAVTISRVDGSSFEFEGVDLVSGVAASQTIDVYGYLDGVLIESETVNLTNTAVTELDVEWEEIDTLVFDPQMATGNYFAMDNFDFIV